MQDLGNSIRNAFNIGLLEGNRLFQDSISRATDPDDFYRFSLTENSEVSFQLSDVLGTVDLDLIADVDRDGTIDRNERIEGERTSSGELSFQADLGPGTYFVRVDARFTSQSDYTLRLNQRSVPSNLQSDPGNSLNRAFQSGNLNRNRIFRDNIGPLDRNDFYQFRLDTETQVTAELSGLSDNARLELISDTNGNGEIDSSDRLRLAFGSASEPTTSLSAALSPGSYWVRVTQQFGFVSTNYRLQLSPSETPTTTPSDPGEQLSDALNIGRLTRPQSFLDNVGPLDFNDFYRFDLTESSFVNLRLNNVSDGLALELAQDTNGNGVIDRNETIDNEFTDSSGNAAIRTQLSSGRYFVRVRPRLVDQTSNYDLTLSARVTTPTNQSDFLGGGLGDDTLVGLDGSDFIVGNTGDDRLQGGAGRDSLFGNDGNDSLLGGLGRDELVGGNGDDVLIGGFGADTIRSGTGRDRITYQEFGERGDTIINFSAGNDSIVLFRSAFPGLGASGILDEERFVLGSFAEDANDRIIYSRGAGRLFYDRDGSGPIDRVVLATFNNQPNLSYENIRVA